MLNFCCVHGSCRHQIDSRRYWRRPARVSCSRDVSWQAFQRVMGPRVTISCGRGGRERMGPTSFWHLRSASCCSSHRLCRPSASLRHRLYHASSPSAITHPPVPFHYISSYRHRHHGVLIETAGPRQPAAELLRYVCRRRGGDRRPLPDGVLPPARLSPIPVREL
jgi:hypothetical protein